MFKKSMLIAITCFVVASLPMSALPSDQDSIPVEAENRAENAVSITSGAVYNAIISVVPEAIVTDYQDGSLAVDFSDADWGEENEAYYYLWASMRSAYKSKFHKEYESISFNYLSDNLVAFLQFSDYKDVAHFTTYLFCTSGRSGTAASTSLNSLYSDIFHNFDRATKQSERLNDIGKQYGLDTNDPEYTILDDIWLFSSFDPGVAHSVMSDEEKAVINYKTGMHDDRVSGVKAWNDLSDAINNFDKLSAQYPDCLGFYKIFIIAFADGTDHRLWQFEVEKKYSGKWDTTTAIYRGDEFQAGINEAHDNQ